MAEPLIDQLRAVTAVADDPVTLQAHAIDQMVPGLVARPRTEAEVAAVLQICSREGAVVIPWGAGAHQRLGHLPERADVVLSLAGLNQVVEYVPADMTVTVQAGMSLAELQELLAPHGQTVPLDPPGARLATVGGLVATGLSGPRRLAYGGVRDLLLGTRVALLDGRVIKTGGRVVKNVAGYDMNKLICGSFGTLGVITEVSLKLRPLPRASQTMQFSFPTREAALEAEEAILSSELLPAAVVVLGEGPGPATLAVALEEMPENVAYQAGRLASTIGAGAVLQGEEEARFWQRLSEAPPRRQPDPWGPPRPEWKLMYAIKNAFDPDRILNRGRYVGGI